MAGFYPERICLSVTGCLGGLEIAEALERAHALGFRSIAVMPDGAPRHSLGRALPTLHRSTVSADRWAELRNRLGRFRRISIHQSWDADWQAWLETAREVGAEIVTVHAGLPRPRAQAEAAWQPRRDFLERLGRAAADFGLALGIENEGGEADLYLQLIDSIPLPNVGATLDIGHCAFFNSIRALAPGPKRTRALNQLLQDIATRLAGRLPLLHVHNVQPYEAVDLSRIPQPYWNPGGFVDHRALPDGEIDIPALLETLRKTGAAPMFELELEEPDAEAAAVRSAKYLEALLHTPTRRKPAETGRTHP